MNSTPGPLAVVMTSIAPPNAVMRTIASDCARLGHTFYVIGDTKSPADFKLDGCSFAGIEDQLTSGFATAQLCPTRSYARKNIGYLMAIRNGAKMIAETDDDNTPTDAFYQPLPLEAEIPEFAETGWINVYRCFDDRLIWPRGFPLDAASLPVPEPRPARRLRLPIQQGLADENPDVDAIYRLLLPLPFSFSRGNRVALAKGAWCPFNSQNTIFYEEAFPLLYLPAHCSFRMTDIWRSFIAQRVAWECGWSILFREATVTQDRNDHDLMRDFADEVVGYQNNRAIAARLEALELEPGEDAIGANMQRCYAALIEDGHVGSEEMPLLQAWLSDLAGAR